MSMYLLIRMQIRSVSLKEVGDFARSQRVRSRPGRQVLGGEVNLHKVTNLLDHVLDLFFSAVVSLIVSW